MMRYVGMWRGGAQKWEVQSQSPTLVAARMAAEGWDSKRIAGGWQTDS